MEMIKKHTFLLLFCLTILCFNIEYSLFGDVLELPEKAPWYISTLKYIMKFFPEINAWFAAVMVGTMAVFRAVSDLLSFIAKRTATKTDDVIAMKLSKLVRFMSIITGWFGLGSKRN